MTHNLRFSFLLTLPWLLSMAAHPQQLAAAAQRPAAQGGAARISLNVVVTAKNGTTVSGLDPKDFKLLDNNVPAQITSFRAVAGDRTPVEVLFVVDTVNIPYSGVSYIRGQMEDFLRKNQGQLTFPTALAILSDTGVQIQQGFSRDGDAEAEMLDHATIDLRDINRSAGFWGATERFQTSVTALRNLVGRESARPGRKLIVWVSPGWPLLSGPDIMLDGKQERQIFGNVVDLSTRLRQADITLYDVDPIGAAEGVGRTFYYESFLKGVSKPSQVDPADLSLQVLAAQSGGLVLTSSNDLVGELQRCEADGISYYAVSFTAPPTEHPDQYHSLSVQIDEPGLTARTVTGYYAQP